MIGPMATPPVAYSVARALPIRPDVIRQENGSVTLSFGADRDIDFRVEQWHGQVHDNMRVSAYNMGWGEPTQDTGYAKMPYDVTHRFFYDTISTGNIDDVVRDIVAVLV